MVLTHR